MNVLSIPPMMKPYRSPSNSPCSNRESRKSNHFPKKIVEMSLLIRDTDQAEYIDGTDMLNGCHALRSGANAVTKTIWLWPGWLSNCLSVNEVVPDFG